MYLRVVLPSLAADSDTTAIAWTTRLGHALINSVEVEIGGSRIDRQYGTWMDVWYELARPAGDQERGFAKMVGDVEELTSVDATQKPTYTLYVPLQFWFNRNTGLALPLIALQYHEVRLHFEFNTFAKCVNYSGSAPSAASFSDATLLVEYAYLDSEERRRFAQVGHEYLIEQVQFTGEESVSNTSAKVKLGFNHPTKSLHWAMRMGNYASGKSFLAYNPNNWDAALDAAAESLALGAIVVNSDGKVETTSSDSPASGTSSIDGDVQTVGNTLWTVTQGGSTTYEVHVVDKPLGVGSADYNLMNRLSAVSVVLADDGTPSIASVTHSLTVRDLSSPVDSGSTQARNSLSTANDVTVNAFSNYGCLIDGSRNPFTNVLLQLNGYDRFDKRAGDYFNYVQPWQHWVNTPADGQCSYSFALKPAEHQPSGTANLSRIDSTQLNLWYADTSVENLNGSQDFALDLINSSTLLYIFAFSYNVLRIMSGMGGLAYSN